MKIDPDDQRASMHRRWGLPVGIAAGVAALSVAAVAVTSGHGAAKPVTAVPALGAGSSTSAAPSPSATATQGSVSGGTGSGPTVVHESSGSGASTVTSATTTPIDAGTVSQILASCLGSDASRYHAVLAARTPIASTDWDGAVVAVDSAGQYVQCETKGSKGTSPDVPPTFINNRMWSPGHLIEFFDSFGTSAGRGKYLLLGAGHYASNIAKITISYGTSPKEYPATMTGGVFFYSAALSVAVTTSTSSSRPVPGPNAYIHAYDASGKEVYKQQD